MSKDDDIVTFKINVIKFWKITHMGMGEIIRAPTKTVSKIFLQLKVLKAA